jgi:hypothetical protein
MNTIPKAALKVNHFPFRRPIRLKKITVYRLAKIIYKKWIR